MVPPVAGQRAGCTPRTPLGGTSLAPADSPLAWTCARQAAPWFESENVRQVVLSRQLIESIRSWVWPVSHSWAYAPQKQGRESLPAHFVWKFRASAWHWTTSGPASPSGAPGDPSAALTSGPASVGELAARRLAAGDRDREEAEETASVESKHGVWHRSSVRKVSRRQEGAGRNARTARRIPQDLAAASRRPMTRAPRFEVAHPSPKRVTALSPARMNRTRTTNVRSFASARVTDPP